MKNKPNHRNRIAAIEAATSRRHPEPNGEPDFKKLNEWQLLRLERVSEAIETSKKVGGDEYRDLSSDDLRWLLVCTEILYGRVNSPGNGWQTVEEVAQELNVALFFLRYAKVEGIEVVGVNVYLPHHVDQLREEMKCRGYTFDDTGRATNEVQWRRTEPLREK
jgi:hypothetical protein